MAGRSPGHFVAVVARLISPRPAVSVWRCLRWVAQSRGGRSFCDRFRHCAGLALISDHKDDDLQFAVRAGIARHRMKCAWRFVKHLAGVERSWWLTIHAELVCALRNIAECVMPRM